MGDSQFSVGVKVVIDVEQERGRIGSIPQAGLGTAQVPSLSAFSSTFAQGPADERVKKLIVTEIDKALEREKTEPKERNSSSALMAAGKLDLPKSQTMEKNSESVIAKTRSKIEGFIANPIDTIADLSGAIPVAGAYIAPVIKGAHRFSRIMASGEGAFLKGMAKSVIDPEIDKLEKALPPPFNEAVKSARGQVDTFFKEATDDSIKIEAANRALSPAIEQTMQFGSAMARLGQGKQSANFGQMIEFGKASFLMEYFQGRMGMYRKQWIGQWAGEMVGKGLLDVSNQVLGR